MTKLNLPQRIIVVVGWGLALGLFGQWVTAIGQRGPFGWVAYSPLGPNSVPSAGGLHPWVRLVIWLALVAAWAAGALWVLRTDATKTRGNRPR